MHNSPPRVLLPVRGVARTPQNAAELILTANVRGLPGRVGAVRRLASPCLTTLIDAKLNHLIHGSDYTCARTPRLTKLIKRSAGGTRKPAGRAMALDHRI